jgi:hypothetical protein
MLLQLFEMRIPVFTGMDVGTVCKVAVSCQHNYQSLVVCQLPLVIA